GARLLRGREGLRPALRRAHAVRRSRGAGHALRGGHARRRPAHRRRGRQGHGHARRPHGRGRGGRGRRRGGRRGAAGPARGQRARAAGLDGTLAGVPQHAAGPGGPRDRPPLGHRGPARRRRARGPHRDCSVHRPESGSRARCRLPRRRRPLGGAGRRGGHPPARRCGRRTGGRRTVSQRHAPEVSMIVWNRCIVAVSLAMLTIPATAGVAQSLAMTERSGRAAQAGASVLDRPALLDVDNLPLPQALLELENASGVSVAFSPSLMDRARRVSCTCRTHTVGEVLDRLLATTRFRYVVLGDQVVIEPAPRGVARNLNGTATPIALGAAGVNGSALAAPATAGADAANGASVQATIAGRVTDARSLQPVVSAQVFIPGTGIGALTDRDGRYLLRNVPPGAVTVRVQSIGYATVERTVTVAEGATAAVDVELVPEAISLDEVIVTATGEARAREMGTSMARITSRDIEARPARNTQDILTAAAPGIEVLQNTGQPGAGGTIRLRGNNSISQGNQPIVYVDGVRIYGGATPTHPAARQVASPLNDINAADIERIEVIKGAAATTLYGTEASSGVIQIFTKKGATGAPRWTAEVTTGFNSMGHVGPKSDPTGMWLNRCRGDGLVGYDGRVFEDPTCPASGSWLRNAPVQNYSLSVSGGLE